MPDPIQLDGAAELSAKLRDMGRKAANKYARAALRPAARIIQREAKALAPIKTGRLRKAIRVNNGKTTADSVTVVVAPGKKWFVGDQFYAALQEFGWFLGKRPRKRFKGSGAEEKYRQHSIAIGRKFVVGKHFMQAAYDNKKGEAEQSIAVEMGKALQEDWQP